MNSQSTIQSIRKRHVAYDYRGHSASVERHSIHTYPAMLHYLMVRDLIGKYTKTDSLIYDPFCGSGVSLVEALNAGRSVYGTDINPLALLIAHVRSSNYDECSLLKTFNSLQHQFNSLPLDVPKVKNMDFWFKGNVVENLGKIRHFITQIQDENVKRFFLCVFSETVRKVSNNRNSEFKRYRIRDIANYNPDTMAIFENTFRLFTRTVITDPITNSNFKLYLHDIRTPVPFDEKVDLVITSPPYGDSRTTVAYGQFSSFSLDWIRGLNPFGDADLSLDRLCLGGKMTNNNDFLPSEVLYKTLESIADRKRFEDVLQFYCDLFVSCNHIFNALNETATVCFIVGDRQVSGVQIPMDLVVADFFQFLGLSLKKILIREISNKRMPSVNSPTNVTGITSSTMKNEYIVILEK